MAASPLNTRLSHRLSGALVSWMPYLAFFTGSFLYFTYFSGYVFFYQEKSFLFILSWEFLTGSLGQPGGFLTWLSGLISSFYYYPVAGALIISLVTSLLIASISRTASIFGGRNEKILPFITGMLLFYLQTNYRFPLTGTLGLLLQSTLIFLVLKYVRVLNGWLPVIIIPSWYYLTGGFSWIFIVAITFYLLFYKPEFRLIKITAAWLIMIASVFLSMEFLFFESGNTLLFYPFELPDDSPFRMAFIFSIALIAALPLLCRISPPAMFSLSLRYNTEHIIRSAFIISILAFISVHAYDRKNIYYFHVEKLFYKGKYDEILDYNTKHPSSNSLTLFYNNIALCENNLLNDRLFRFLQGNDGRTLFLKWEMVTEILKRGGYFYYTIGMINEAHRWAFENMVMEGHTPEGLKMLIRTELINGNYQMASKYITLLGKTLFYGKDAAGFEKFLFNDNAVEADPDLGTARREKLRTDFFSITDDPIINIDRIVASDSLNRKAFEYRVAYSLLRKDMKALATMLPEFGKKGFSRLPVHVEEAALAIQVSDNGRMPDTGTLRVSRESETRWTQFLTLFEQYGSDPRVAEPALRSQFGNTFWYWAFYK